MKRIKHAVVSTNKKKNGKTKQNNNEKSILDYLKKPVIPQSIIDQKIPQVEENNNKNKNLFNIYIKPEVPKINISESYENYKNKIIINEDFINNFNSFFHPIFEKIKISFSELQEKQNIIIYNEEIYNKFSENLNSLITKFFLHIEDYLYTSLIFF